MTSREIVLGIDFGSTSVVAAACVDGQLYLVPDEQGDPFLPCRGHPRPADLYNRLKELAERRFRRPVLRATLTVRSGASAAERAAVEQAAVAAGLEPIDVLPEPSAALVAEGLDRFLGHRRLVVCDIGAARCDVTVIAQHHGRFEPIATAVDGKLGGDAYDRALADHGAQLARSPVRPGDDRTGWLAAAEATKRALSEERFAPLLVRSAAPREMLVHRDDLVSRWRPLADGAAKLAFAAVQQANLRVSGIDTFVLIGGTSRIPVVRARVPRTFGRPCPRVAEPDTAVARGAAVAGARRLASAA